MQKRRFLIFLILMFSVGAQAVENVNPNDEQLIVYDKKYFARAMKLLFVAGMGLGSKKYESVAAEKPYGDNWDLEDLYDDGSFESKILKRLIVKNNLMLDPKEVAVIVVDVQQDFTQEYKGSLGCAGTDAAYLDLVSSRTNRLINFLPAGHVFVSKDAHPENHVGFAKAGEVPSFTPNGTWPTHCVVGTTGQHLAFKFDDKNENKIRFVMKGNEPNYDSYSAFYAHNAEEHRGDAKFCESLHSNGLLEGITKAIGAGGTILIYGLATDVCVRATASSAKKLGFKPIVISELCRGVTKENHEKALAEMESAGIKVKTGVDII